jgi:serine/threonine protein kinase
MQHTIAYGKIAPQVIAKPDAGGIRDLSTGIGMPAPACPGEPGMALDTKNSVVQTAGSYDLIDKIADGGMGSVYKARHRGTGQIVAIKIVPPHMTRNAVLLKRFEQEFRTASKLDHPNIVRALDFGSTGDSPYLVMEFVDGESLGQRLERDGKMSEVEAVRIIAQVAQGLHRAHKQGLIHRDVKPDNILMTADGVAKLADLGLVKEVDAELNLTRTGRGLGTPHFMAPEQFRNAKNVDRRCDIYSMAATLYMMVTGELPFKSCGPLDAWMKKIQNELMPARQVNPAVSERINWAIRRGMSADPEQRPANCREFVEDLTGHSTRKPQPAESVTENGQEIWYLGYRDDEDVVHTVKGTVAAIRHSLKEGLLGDASNVRASRSKAGPFEPLRNYPEFRDLIVVPAPMSVPSAPAASTKAPSPATPAAADSPLPAAPVSESAAVPHIPISDKNQANLDWLSWVFLALLAAGTTVAGLFLFRP